MSDINSSRRNVLKTVGASAVGLTTVSTGVSSASHLDSLSVRIHNRKDVSDSTMDDIQDAVSGFLRQLYENSAIGGYVLKVDSKTLYDRYHGEEMCCNALDSYDKCDIELKDECDGDWFDEATNAVVHDPLMDEDVHLFATTGTNFASAYSPDNEEGEAWMDGPATCWVGTAGDYDSTPDEVGRIKNLAIQEIGHTLIDDDVIDDRDSYDDAGEAEHALGTLVRPSYWASYGPVTPMATYYEDDGVNPCGHHKGNAIREGECSSDINWNEEHTQEVTDCTIDAIRKTNDKHGFSTDNQVECED